VTEGRPRILVLGLGNDILGDDAVGLLAARRLRVLLPESVDVVESGGGGLDLLDVLEGYDRALLLDAILTGKHPPGTILEFSAEDLKKDDAPSPHYAGLPTVIQLAESLSIHFPMIFQIVAVEIENPYEVLEGLSDTVEATLPAVVERARAIVSSWLSTGTHPISLGPTEGEGHSV
jgi:hydrogenase maturation protease